MHHILRGALGAGLVYPLAWYYYAHSGPVQPAASKASHASVEEQQHEPLGSSEQPTGAVPAPQRAPAARETPRAGQPPVEPLELRAIRQRVAEAAPRLTLPTEPERPRSPKAEEPKVPFPAFAELQDALGQMKELQAVAHDPKALDERVQLTEYDAQKVARLKALAEQFVELPPPPGERYLPAGKPSRSSSSR